MASNLLGEIHTSKVKFQFVVITRHSLWRTTVESASQRKSSLSEKEKKVAKEIKQYQCEICGALYDSEDAAIDCEHVHAHISAVERKLYSPGHVYPDILHVRLNTGSLWVYKLIRKIEPEE